MVDDSILLKSMYKNNQIIINNIENVLPKIKYYNLKKVLKLQVMEYNKINKEINDCVKNYDIKNINGNSFIKLFNVIKTDLIMLKKESSKKIAKNILDNTNNVLIKVLVINNKYVGLENRTIELVKKYRIVLENSVYELKKYI